MRSCHNNLCCEAFRHAASIRGYILQIDRISCVSLACVLPKFGGGGGAGEMRIWEWCIGGLRPNTPNISLYPSEFLAISRIVTWPQIQNIHVIIILN